MKDTSTQQGESKLARALTDRWAKTLYLLAQGPDSDDVCESGQHMLTSAGCACAPLPPADCEGGAA